VASCADPDAASRWTVLGPGENTGGATSAVLAAETPPILPVSELDSDTAEERSDDRALASCLAVAAAEGMAIPVELATDAPDSLSPDGLRPVLDVSAPLLALRDDRRIR